VSVLFHFPLSPLILGGRFPKLINHHALGSLSEKEDLHQILETQEFFSLLPQN